MNIRFFEIAKLAAIKSEHRIKIGAVLVKNGKPVAIGFNKVGKTHPKAEWFIHAELDCVLETKHTNWKNTTLYVYRTNRLDQVLNCKPCHNCQEVLKLFGVKKVYYTTGASIEKQEYHKSNVPYGDWVYIYHVPEYGELKL